MIPLAVPNLCGNEKKYLNQCVDENFVSSVGPFVDRFEKMVAESSKSKFAVSTASGTAALHLALKVLDVGAGDLVITPSYTFVATINSIIHSGAEPWLFDVEANTWSLDPQLVASALRHETQRENGQLKHKKSGQRVAAILPVYINGAPSDMEAFKSLAEEFKLPLVADGAAAIGLQYKRKSLSDWAELTTFSFNGNKIVTSGGGGAIVTNNEVLAKKAKHLCTTARLGSDYNHDAVGFNYRMTNIEAAVGCAQLENLEVFLAKKRAIQEEYNKKLMNLNLGLSSLPKAQTELGTCWLSGVVLDAQRNPLAAQVIQKMAEKNITVRPFWRPAHLQTPYKNYRRTIMPICESIWPRVISLPCSTSLTSEEQHQVIQSLVEVLSEGQS